MKKILSALALSFFLLPAFAMGTSGISNQPAYPSMYLGLQAGLAYDGLPSSEKVVGDIVDLKKDKSRNLGARIFTGYNFNKYIAFEGGFLVTDNREVKFLVFNKDLLAKVKINEKILDFTPRVNFPIGDKFKFYVRAGVAYIDALNENKDVKYFNYVYGLGVDYSITQSISLGIAYSHYNGGGNKLADVFNQTAAPSLDFYSASISYKFG
jgi:opacity protein-like surface antigen